MSSSRKRNRSEQEITQRKRIDRKEILEQKNDIREQRNQFRNRRNEILEQKNQIRKQVMDLQRQAAELIRQAAEKDTPRYESLKADLDLIIDQMNKEKDEMNKEIEAIDVEVTNMTAQIEKLDLSFQADTSDDYFEKIKKVGAPSSLSRGDRWKNVQKDLLYLCHTPPEAEPPFPLTLVHPAFGKFVDRFNTSKIEFGSEECELVQKLCNLVVGDHVKEQNMMSAFNELLGSYLNQKIVQILVLNYTTDGSLLSENHMVYLVEGKKNEGIAMFQAMQYYSLFLYTMKEHEKESTFCPCFLVELVGFNIRISGLAFFKKVACQPFTPFMHCYFNSYDKTDMDSLCRAMLALKQGLSELRQYYSPHPNPPPAVDKSIPYPLWEKRMQCVERIGRSKLLFLVKMEQSQELRLFKFCKRYGEEVHKLWAADGLAPKLFDCQRIAGAWFAVEMEYLPEHDWKSVYQWCNDAQSVDKVGLRRAIQSALERAHKLDEGVAHGDVRAPNIMAKSVEGTFEIKFVDFDWAGKVSTTFYPSFINTEEKWHEDVGPGKPLSQDHDKWWEDQWIQGGTTT